MGKWRFRKTEPSNVRGLCVLCNKNPQKSKGGGKFAPLCYPCNKREYENMDAHRERTRRYKSPYVDFKKEVCELCGFIPKHACKLDVDHINGNHKDNREENLQTLCANCHRLKTFTNKDWGR